MVKANCKTDTGAGLDAEEHNPSIDIATLSDATNQPYHASGKEIDEDEFLPRHI